MICSPLKTVSVDFAPLGRGLRVDNLQRRNPILIFASHSSTLKEISGSHFAMLPGDCVFDAVYPSVHTIKASFSNILPPATLPYIVAFPNLTHLSLTTPVSSSSQGTDVTTRLARALRRRFWQRGIQENHALKRTWTKLEELEGGLTDILALGLPPCHLPMLRLTGTLSEKPEYDHVKTLLEDTRPAGLAIIMHIADASTFGDTMRPVFSDPSAQQLRALEVELVFSASEGGVDIHMVLSNVATTLAVLPLHRVTLTLNHGLLTAPEESNRPRSGWFCPLGGDVEGFDVVATQAVFRAAIPSLVMDVVLHISTDRTPHASRIGVAGGMDRA